MNGFHMLWICLVACGVFQHKIFGPGTEFEKMPMKHMEHSVVRDPFQPGHGGGRRTVHKWQLARQRLVEETGGQRKLDLRGDPTASDGMESRERAEDSRA